MVLLLPCKNVDVPLIPMNQVKSGMILEFFATTSYVIHV